MAAIFQFSPSSGSLSIPSGGSATVIVSYTWSSDYIPIGGIAIRGVGTDYSVDIISQSVGTFEATAELLITLNAGGGFSGQNFSFRVYDSNTDHSGAEVFYSFHAIAEQEIDYPYCSWEDNKYTYDGKFHFPIVVQSDAITYSGVMQPQKDAGSYTTTISLKTGYKWNDATLADPYASVTITWEITKAYLAWTVVPSRNELDEYTGQPQTLISGGSAPKGAQAVYSKNNISWSQALPTGEDAGYYTVYAKLELDDPNNYDTSDTYTFENIYLPPKQLNWIVEPQKQTGLVYDGSNWFLITEGTAPAHATAMYSALKMVLIQQIDLLEKCWI